MNYINGENILPRSVLEELQKYVQGELIYVPVKQVNRADWGEKSGARAYMKQRNQEIHEKYKKGVLLQQLAQEYFISEDCIRKIIYKQSKLMNK
jgi:Mor family transcriptional regulator